MVNKRSIIKHIIMISMFEWFKKYWRPERDERDNYTKGDSLFVKSLPFPIKNEPTSVLCPNCSIPTHPRVGCPHDTFCSDICRDINREILKINPLSSNESGA
jgi:hypothetical protein